MYSCANCHRGLARVRPFWLCRGCGGRAISVKAMRRRVEPRLVDQVWALARQYRDRPGDRHRPCPICTRAMVEVRPDEKLPPIDVCRRCAMVWLDPHELEQLPPVPAEGSVVAVEMEAPRAEAPPPEPALSLTEPIKDADRYDDPDAGTPFQVKDEWAPFWQWGGLLLGMSMEVAGPPQRQWPWATLTVAALVTLASLAAFFNLGWAINHFALVPSRALRDGGLTLVTSFFLHADFSHLIGNLYFLILFGSHVEDYLGRLNFVLLLVLASLCGDALQIALDPQRNVPSLGASGGISGLVAFYALRFPRAKVVLLFGRLFPFRFSIWLYFVVWVAVQVFGVAIQLSGNTGTAYLAHLGGALVGTIFWLQDDSWKWRKGRGRLVLHRQPVSGAAR